MADEQVFSGTARYYSLYRPRYPEELLHDLVALSVGDRGGSMVDWGCGTGEVALPLSSYFDDITAIDIDAGMVGLAREKASQQDVSNIRWIVGPAEDLELTDASQDLIVAGSSFHWMDRELLSRRAFSALIDRGVIAIIGGGSDVWDIKCDWHEVAVRMMKRWLGDQRRAGSSTYTVTKKHGDFLEPAGFTLESRRYRVEQNWNADAIVGYLYSTSFANPALFGERLSDFEADLRAELAKLSTGDSFPELLDFYVMFGRKRSA
ncbi:class I SAM-dependent methyltransferase [Dactylosporangium sp. CA-092794]|uniref:class I SAM-dependent methyltransferase n=1 Tax=Dactylosporangium sp. CA-092794 TaxID=3239929 RepID=UPI003D8E6EE6